MQMEDAIMKKDMERKKEEEMKTMYNQDLEMKDFGETGHSTLQGTLGR